MPLDKAVSQVYLVVPVYNVEKYIGKCLNSILNQTFTKIRVVVVDDGSTDNSGIICDDFAKMNADIVVIHQSNKGLAEARNTGIDFVMNNPKKPKGKCLIGFIDSDDYIHPDMIASLVTVFQSNESASIVGADAKTFFEQDEVHNVPVNLNKVKIIDSYEFSRQYLTHVLSVSVCNKLFDLSLFDSIRFAEGRLNEDGLLIYEMVISSKSYYAHLSEPLYYYLMREGSISGHGFGKSIIDLAGNFKKIELITLEYTPGLAKEASDNVLYGCATFCNTVPVKYFCRHFDGISKEVVSEVRKRRKTIKKSDLRYRDKLILSMFAFMPCITVALVSIYRNIVRVGSFQPINAGRL